MDFDEKATRDYLRKLILNLYSVSEELNDETELVASGIIDSFGIVRVIDEIEKEFKIKIPNEGLIPQNFCSISAISNFISILKTIWGLLIIMGTNSLNNAGWGMCFFAHKDLILE